MDPLAEVGAPALVAVADVYTSEQQPTWNRPLGIGLAVAGYLLSSMRVGGSSMNPFLKNLGIAAAPWAFESIYQYAKQGTFSPTARMTRTPVGRSVASHVARPIGRYPAPIVETPFESVRLV